MTPPQLCSVASVREYMALNSSSSDSKYSDDTIGSNIKAAGWYLERATGRRFADRTETLKFTTNGQAFLPIPGFRTVTSVTLQGAALTADSTYYLIPDVQQTGVYTGVQFRAFSNRGNDYRSNPEWFDRNLDRYPFGSPGFTSLPNDLSIAGDTGYTDAALPEPVRHATKVLAGYYTKRPDSILSGGITTPDGGIFDLSNLPIEVQSFIAEWRVGSYASGL